MTNMPVRGPCTRRFLIEARHVLIWQVDSLDGYGEWVRMLVPMLKSLGATPEELRQVFRDNARRVYRLGA